MDSKRAFRLASLGSVPWFLVLGHLGSSQVASAAGAAPALTVDEAVQRGRDSQPALRAAVGTAEAAHQRVGEAFGGYLPQVSGNLQYQLATSNYVLSPGLSRLVGPSGSAVSACLSASGGLVRCPARVATVESEGAYSYVAPQLNVTQTLWDFGRTLNAVAQAEASARGAAEDLGTARHQVDLNVRTAFYTALANQQLVEVAQQQLEAMKKHLALAQSRFEVGAGSKSDISLATANQENAEVALLTAQNNVDVAKATLNQAMGVPTIRIDYQLTPASLDLNAPLPAVEEGIARALESRPDYKSASEKVEAQERAVAGSRDNLLPTLSATGQVNWASYWTLPLTYNWQLGAQLSVPIYTGGIDFHKIHEAEATLAALQANRDSVGLQVRLDVQTAVLTASQSKASLASAAAAVRSGDDALALAEGQYQVGTATIVNVDDAQVTDVTAKAAQIQADYNYQTALARLHYALGTD